MEQLTNLHKLFSPCLRRCSTSLLSTTGTPSSTRPLSCSSDRDAPNTLVFLAGLDLRMGIWTIFFMSSVTSTAVLLCWMEKSRYCQLACAASIRWGTQKHPAEGRLAWLSRLDSVWQWRCVWGVHPHTHLLQQPYCHILCVQRAKGFSCEVCCYDKYQVTTRQVFSKAESHTHAHTHLNKQDRKAGGSINHTAVIYSFKQ